MYNSRLSKTLESALNAQITHEAYAAQIYLGYGAWCAQNGYSGIAKLLFKHANEERDHMTKILEYILKRSGKVILDAIPKPHEDPKGISDCFEKIFRHETATTNQVYDLVKMTVDEGDWATGSFLQWFVIEQIEEESFVQNLNDKVRIAGGDNITSIALYELDRDIATNARVEKTAQEATAQHP